VALVKLIRIERHAGCKEHLVALGDHERILLLADISVTLNGVFSLGAGANVKLVSSNPSVVSVPGTVSIPSGSKSANFPVTFTAVTSTTVVTISATYTGVTVTTTLTVTP
jgi:hypothetical protein